MTQKNDEKILILGGARSGKSSYALTLAKDIIKPHKTPSKKALFLATASPKDKEMQKRIEAHKRERGELFHTIEEEFYLANCLRNRAGSFDVIVIDCITMWITNLFLNKEKELENEIKDLEKLLNELTTPTIMISNEIGLGIVPENKMARKFRDILGKVNQRLARLSTSVIFMAAGIPLKIK